MMSNRNYKTKRIIEKTYWIFNIVLLFLFGMQFMGFPRKIAFLWLGMVVLIESVRYKKNIFDIPVILLGLGGISYAVIAGNDLVNTIMFAGLPVFMYLAGKVWCMRAPSFCRTEINSKLMIMALTVGTFTGGLLEKYSRFFRFTEECYSGRYWFDFWDGGIRPATYYMFYAMMALGVVFWALYTYKKQKVLSTCFLVFGVIELVFFAWVETRTPFLVAALVLFAEIALFLWLNRKEKYAKPVLIAITVMTGVVIAVAAVVWFGNIANIQSSTLGHMLTHDGGIFGNVRFKAQRNALMQMFEYPMGGKQMDIAGLKYVHNVWLDIAYTAGVIPFVFIAAYTIGTFICCIKLVKNKEISQDMKYLMTGVFIALHLNYSVEPVLDANLVFWAMGACVSGMIKGYGCNRGEQ